MKDEIQPSYASAAAWALDFWYAFLERPKILRWIAKLAMGKYAYREIYGAKQAVKKYGWFRETCGYDLKNMDYHKDKVEI